MTREDILISLLSAGLVAISSIVATKECYTPRRQSTVMAVPLTIMAASVGYLALTMKSDGIAKASHASLPNVFLAK
jgi:hypothetical protein